MMLRARFLRWCHGMWFIMRPWKLRQAVTGNRRVCRNVTYMKGLKTIGVWCDCGKMWG